MSAGSRGTGNGVPSGAPPGADVPRRALARSPGDTAEGNGGSPINTAGGTGSKERVRRESFATIHRRLLAARAGDKIRRRHLARTDPDLAAFGAEEEAADVLACARHFFKNPDVPVLMREVGACESGEAGRPWASWVVQHRTGQRDFFHDEASARRALDASSMVGA